MSEQEIARAPKKGGLGKGLNSLLGLNETQASSTLDRSQLIEIAVDAIDANPHQPRKIFKQEELDELTASLKQDGLMQPIVVSKPNGGRYTIIAGERRWRASKRAGLNKIPALVKEVSSIEMLRLAIIENVQRSNLNVIEEAEAYSALIKEFGLSQEACASQVGKDRATVANLIRLLKLPNEVQEAISEGKLSSGHGRALLSLPTPALVSKAKKLIVERNLNVRQTEELVKKLKRESLAEAPGLALEEIARNSDLDYLADNLRSHLRTKVKLAGTGSRGKIEISYFSAAELERLLQIIGGRQFDQ